MPAGPDSDPKARNRRRIGLFHLMKNAWWMTGPDVNIRFEPMRQPAPIRDSCALLAILLSYPAMGVLLASPVSVRNSVVVVEAGEASYVHHAVEEFRRQIEKTNGTAPRLHYGLRDVSSDAGTLVVVGRAMAARLEFVDLFVENRKLLDRYHERPREAKLFYWIAGGWGRGTRDEMVRGRRTGRPGIIGVCQATGGYLRELLEWQKVNGFFGAPPVTRIGS